MPERAGTRLALEILGALQIFIAVLLTVLYSFSESERQSLQSDGPPGWRIWAIWCLVALVAIGVALIAHAAKVRKAGIRLGGRNQVPLLRRPSKVGGTLPADLDPERWYAELYRVREYLASGISRLQWTANNSLLGYVVASFLGASTAWAWISLAIGTSVGAALDWLVQAHAGRRLAHVDELLWRIIERERADA